MRWFLFASRCQCEFHDTWGRCWQEEARKKSTIPAERIHFSIDNTFSHDLRFLLSWMTPTLAAAHALSLEAKVEGGRLPAAREGRTVTDWQDLSGQSWLWRRKREVSWRKFSVIFSGILFTLFVWGFEWAFYKRERWWKRRKLERKRGKRKIEVKEGNMVGEGEFEEVKKTTNTWKEENKNKIKMSMELKKKHD